MLQWIAGLMLLGVLAFALASLSGCDSSEPYQRKNGLWSLDAHTLVEQPTGELTVLNRRFARTTTQAFHRQACIEGAQAEACDASRQYLRGRPVAR